MSGSRSGGTNAEGPSAPSRRPARIPTAAIVAFVLLAVFALPWVVPASVNAVLSDSQAVGFNNRVSMLGLGAGMLALFLIAWRAGRDDARADGGGIISLTRASRGDRVSGWLVIAGIALVVSMVGVVAFVLRSNPYSDALYFTNVFLRVAAGGKPFTEIEFAYGPLQFFLPYGTWRALAWTGVSVYPVYYTWVAIFQASGLLLAAFILNRLRMTHRLRNAAFAFAVVVAFIEPTLSLSYTGVRFLLPYAAFLWVIARLTTMRDRPLRHALPLLAAALTAGISPEMGIALAGALAVALVWLSARDSGRHAVSLLVLVVGMAALLAVAQLLIGAGTVSGFAGGAFYFPVLPSATVLLFVAGALVLAQRSGWTFGSASRQESAAVLGWLALAVALIVPALGRADFTHVTWNSLGVMLACVAALGGRPRLAGSYVGVASVAFIVAASIALVAFHASILRVAALRSFVTSPQRARQVGTLLGESSEGIAGLWAEQQSLRASDHEAAIVLSALPRLAFPNFLSGEVGKRLSERGDLVPLYVSHPNMAITRSDYERFMSQMDEAENVAIYNGQVAGYEASARGAEPDAEGVVMAVPREVGGDVGARWNVNLGFPLKLKGRNEVLDPSASFGLWLERDWVPYLTVGDYTVFRRR